MTVNPLKVPVARLANDFPAPLAEAAFYGLAGDIVKALSPETEADPAALLVHLLTEVGNMVGRSVYMEAGGARHYLNLFAVLVGETSKGRKGTAAACVKRVTLELDREWRENRVLSGLSSGEGMKWAVRDPIRKEQGVKREKRFTGETESVITDEGVTDKRLLVIEGEFGSVLHSMNREKNTLSATLRLAWDGEKLATLTKNDPVTATGAHISIIGHITQGEIRRLLTANDSANGFANRFLWVAARRSKPLPEGGNLAGVRLEAELDLLRDILSRAAELKEIRRNDEARKLWAEVYPELSEGKPGLVGSVTSRAEAQVLRLSCLYALLDGAAFVEPDHLKAALALWDYCERSARWIFGTATGNPDADKILSALKGAGATGLTATEISGDVFNRHRSSEQIEQALRLLHVSGEVTYKDESTAGANARRWFADG